MRALYVILVLCTLALVAVAVGIWRLVKRRMRDDRERH